MAKQSINKTNAARLLDKAKIAYELIPYEVDENDLSAPHVAESLGEDIAQGFKTLVLQGDRSGYFVCVVPGDATVDLKLAAKVSGNKKCEMIHMKQMLLREQFINQSVHGISIALASVINQMQPENKAHNPLLSD